MLGWDDALILGTVGAAQSGVNSALGVGSSFLGDWFGDSNRQDQSNTDFSSYVKKTGLDWQFYHDAYAPFNQKLQKEMFDYTSAGNLKNSEDYFDYTLAKSYDANIRSIGDSLAARKKALLENGYNPILAVNGGLSAGPGSFGGSTIGSSGQLGSLGSPHSSSGVNSSASNPHVDLGRLSLSELAGLAVTAKQLDKMDAEQKETQAKTAQIIEQTKHPGMAGDVVRTLDNVVKRLGNEITDTWHSAVDALRNTIHPVQELHYHNHSGPNWEYDNSLRKSIYVPDNQGR